MKGASPSRAMRWKRRDRTAKPRLRTSRSRRAAMVSTYSAAGQDEDSVTTVGLVGFSTYPFAYDLLDIARSAEVVDSIRPLVDLLVVTFHGGAEGVRALHVPEAAESLAREPRGELRRWARAVVDAGADAVVGHGPHVLRGIELYREKPIAYSLGNFLTWRGFNLSGALGITGVMGVQAILNMLVAMGFLPTKGLTLPFVSYGGTSLVLCLTAAGVLLAISGGKGGFLLPQRSSRG